MRTEEREAIIDAIGDASWCNDGDCPCHARASLARDILDGKENMEVWYEMD